jgi:hypothetical protein
VTGGSDCTSSGVKDPPGLDDAFCFDAAFAAALGVVPLGGCIDADADFDGVPYRKATWPGTLADHGLDRVLHAEPFIFLGSRASGSTIFGACSMRTRVAHFAKKEITDCT